MRKFSTTSYPPERWHEPRDATRTLRFVLEQAGAGYRHPVTPEEILERLALLPQHFLANLEVIQFSRMTRKRHSFPCYGMHWGCAIYLYPIEESFEETYSQQPSPAREIEARMYGGNWVQENGLWKLRWTEASIKDYYLNNILIHEIGHLVDDRNTNAEDRERFAEWFAIEHGYRACRRRGAVGLHS